MDKRPKYFSKTKPVKCPNCGAKKVVAIRYGLPSSRLEAEAEAGKVVLGGCCVTDSDPSWECTGCAAQIYHEEPRSRVRKKQSAL